MRLEEYVESQAHSPHRGDLMLCRFSSRFTEINSVMHARWKLIYRRDVFVSRSTFSCRLRIQSFNFCYLPPRRRRHEEDERNVFDMHKTMNYDMPAFHASCVARVYAFGGNF